MRCAPMLFCLSCLAPVAAGAADGVSGRTARLLQQVDADGNGMISRAEAQKLPALAADFDRIDANRDGQVTPDELRTWKRQAGRQRSGKSGLAEAFARADRDGDGRLSRAEAGEGMPRLLRRFDAIDANRDGAISLEELRAHLRQGGSAGAGRR